MTNLKPGHHRTTDKQRRGSCNYNHLWLSLCHQTGWQTPSRYDEQPHQRNVSIAVGHGLVPGLHQPDHRHQRSQIPQPTYDEMRLASRPPDHDAGHASQNHNRPHHNPQRPHAERIKSGQPARPKHLFDVTHVGDRGVNEPHANWDTTQRSNQTATLLGPIRHNTRGYHQCQERKFFTQQSAQRRLAIIVSVGRFCPLRPSQRPIVQQQQHKRQRHHHRFGHKPQGV